MKEKILIIGLDGATWNVLNPLIESGILSSIAYLKRNGAYGVLDSVFPPITGPAWVSLATGKNPGKTGIFDFLNRRDKGFNLEPIDSRDFIKNGAFWDYLSQKGRKVGIYNYPFLYPPYQINGFMISGFGSPENSNIIYPSDLKAKLADLIKDYRISVPFGALKYRNNEELFLKDIYKLLDKQKEIIKILLDSIEIDVFFVVISASDFLQHYMWKYWEEDSQCDKNAAKYRNDFINIWRFIDQIMDFIINKFMASHIFIVSDHGFGDCKKSFLVNTWLEREGYLIRRKDFKTEMVSKLREINFEKLLPKAIYRAYGKLASLFLSKGIISTKFTQEQIDLTHSRAFALNHSTVGQIYINSMDKNPNAPISSKEEYSMLRKEIIDKLRSFVIESGEAEKIEIYSSDEIYFGEKVKYLPDIVFLIDDCGCDIINNRFEKRIWLPKALINKSGNHRKEGIFIGYGSHIKNLKLENLNITDFAPTILYLMNSIIPQDVDGRVIFEMFKKSFIRSHPFELKEEPPKDIVLLDRKKSKKDIKIVEKDIRKILEGLGYL